MRCSTAAAELHNIPYEVLTGAEVNARFPGYRLPEHFSVRAPLFCALLPQWGTAPHPRPHALRPAPQAFYQPDSGILAAEECVAAHAAVARQHGAQLLEGVRVQSWQAAPSGGVTVTTADGVTFQAGKLVLCSGPWIGQQVPELQVRPPA